VLRQPAKEVAKFLDAMPDLSNRLKKLAEKENIAISFKTHRLMDSFMGHNDSLKVYYYDASKKAVVTEAVRQWANANKIVTAKRTHEHGTDISSAEGIDRKEGTGSHGQRIADKLARSLLETIKKHGKSFSPEQYYQWITKYAIQLIASVK
jgi:Na+/phosphate symporter